MSRTYRLSEQAEAHVDAIADFIAGDSVDAAVKVVLALEDAFVLLAARPGIATRLRLVANGNESLPPSQPSLVFGRANRTWVQRVASIRYNRFEVVSHSASPISDGSE